MTEMSQQNKTTAGSKHDSQCDWKLKASHYLHESNATNFSERNKIQTEWDITAIPHDYIVFIVTALNN